MCLSFHISAVTFTMSQQNIQKNKQKQGDNKVFFHPPLQ